MSEELGQIVYKGETYELRDNTALHQDAAGSWMPDFANLKPLATYEYDISSTSYFKICERPNVTDITDIADEVLAFRITVTGTGIFSIADVLVRTQPTVNTYPRATINYQTMSTTAATTGIRYFRIVCPKAANTSYAYELAIAAYNTTKRHIKVEVFKAPSEWIFASAATTYSYNSTYQTAADLTLYTRIGLIGTSTHYINTSYSDYAAYNSVWMGLFNSNYVVLVAGAAIAANQFAFVGEDNKLYPVTNTTQPILTAWPIMFVTSAIASGANCTWSYLRTWGHGTPATSVLRDTLAAHDTVYLKCTYMNGKVYSQNRITPTIGVGSNSTDTYYKLGVMYNTTALAFNTMGGVYFTVDMDGNMRAINGYSINAENANVANAVKRQFNIVGANDYPILFDSNPSSNITTATTIPSLTPALKYNPSTGNLTSGVFTGSGAGLTDIPSSGINYDELPTIADYAGPSGSGRFVTFLQNESDDLYTHPYLLEAPNAMTYRVGTDSMVFTNGVGLRRYKLGFYGARYSNTNSTSTFWATCLKTPIEIDPSTHIPTNSLIVDGAKMTFRFYGDVTYADASSDYIDTYFTLCYQNQNGSGNWSVYYETRGDIHYGASVTYSDNRVAIVIGWAYDESTYNKHLQNFKAYRYIDSAVDHLGSTLGYASGTSDYCKLIENRSNWSAIAWQGSASESWSDVLSQVYPNGYIEGIRGGSSQDDELLPTKLLHVHHDLDNDTYSFTDSLTDAEIADILQSAFDGEINLNVELSDVDTVQLLKYYYPFNYVFLRVLMFETDPVAGIDQTAWTNNALPSYFAIAFAPGDPPTFQFISISGANLANKENLSNKVTTIDDTSTDDQYPSAKAVYTVRNTLSGLIQDVDEAKYNITGGNITGDVILKAAAATDSPALIFQRGTLSDNYNDWRIQDRGGFLRFDQRGNGSTSWSEMVQINTSGTIGATSFSGSGASLTSLNASNISSGTLNAARLPATVELTTNKTTTVDSTSTDDQYPSAKAVYDAIPSKVEYSSTPFVGTCSTAAGTMAKTVTVDSSFQLVDGVRVRVYMEHANTNTAPTLNVNGTGAKQIGVQSPGGATSNAVLSAWNSGAFARNGWYEFFYAASYNSNNGRWILSDEFSAGRLENFAAARLSTINSTNGTGVNAGVKYSVVPNGATGNPFVGSAAVLWLSHDTSAAYTRQIALSTNTPPHMAFRSQDSGGGTSWQDWEYVLTAANQYDSHMATLAYTAAGVAFSNNALTIPIDGTQYKILQATVFNNDFNAGSLGYPALFSFNAAGSSGYIIGTTTYCVVRSAASGITLEFDSSWSLLSSTSVDVQVLYRRIS